jgi:hypothetical protein
MKTEGRYTAYQDKHSVTADNPATPFSGTWLTGLLCSDRDIGLNVVSNIVVRCETKLEYVNKF